MATRTDTGSPTLHAADSHDLIRVQGARVNNLKDVSVELPKRRMTVFTGISGSGKSSLVFGTVAAESQRMINETYSTFVQGFMPSLNRPDVDLLDGLTTAIVVDQERLGANPRSTVGTVTDANAMLRIVFSRLGTPQIGSAQAFSFNVASVSGAGAVADPCGPSPAVPASMSIDQARRQRLRQLRGADLGAGGFNVVGHAPERQGRLIVVVHRVARGRVAVARLAHAARVDQPIALGELQLLPVVARLAAGRSTRKPAERQGDVRVADQGDALGLNVEAELRLERREHVLPHRVTGTGVVEPDDLIGVRGFE